MEYFAGLDVSIEETAICVVGDDGKVVLESEVPTEPELIAEALERFAGRLRRVGHEAGSVSPWLHAGLLALGLPAVCLLGGHFRMHWLGDCVHRLPGGARGRWPLHC